MPIKIFAAPGDHRDDFGAVEQQVNAWIEQANPTIDDIEVTVSPMPEKSGIGTFMMTLVVLYA